MSECEGLPNCYTCKWYNCVDIYVFWHNWCNDWTYTCINEITIQSMSYMSTIYQCIGFFPPVAGVFDGVFLSLWGQKIAVIFVGDGGIVCTSVTAVLIAAWRLCAFRWQAIIPFQANWLLLGEWWGLLGCVMADWHPFMLEWVPILSSILWCVCGALWPENAKFHKVVSMVDHACTGVTEATGDHRKPNNHPVISIGLGWSGSDRQVNLPCNQVLYGKSMPCRYQSTVTTLQCWRLPEANSYCFLPGHHAYSVRNADIQVKVLSSPQTVPLLSA